MEIHQDNQGLEYTISNSSSVEQFEKLVLSFMGYKPDVGAKLKALLAEDPSMPMGLCMKGYLAKMMGLKALHPRALAISETLTDEKYKQLSHRESLHIQALEVWCSGNLKKTVDIWEEILLHYPLDSIALRLAYFNHFYSGDARRMRDSLIRVLPYWDSTHPHYGYVLGLYSFALEECSDFQAAEQYGREAVQINPEDAWSVHAVAHVMESQERHQEGIQWLFDLEESWTTVNNFRFHLHWHQCLFLMEEGDYKLVLDLYDRILVSDLDSDFYLDLCNAASLLWRLELHGVEIGERWKVLLEAAQRRIEDRDLVFASLHYLMVLVAAGDDQSISRIMDEFKQWASSDDTQGWVMRRVGMTLANVLIDIRQGRPNHAFQNLFDIRYEIDLIGGSIAQRDLFSMLLLDVAGQASQHLAMRALGTERITLRPSSQWARMQYGQALEHTKDQFKARPSIYPDPDN
ncbi:MAG: tetratricopeptide repeat protein [Gammaproteobacteria bacterium]|nr:tetratricopeptide repeat protein [Gammaproteobacteria bacterium]MCY4218042.1 tetratricopeptide repeat protein [Gammaproteobacteria bacterium]MCY4274050.1 tetratricopeptide repeat protein [Gammaproteobacteria bacterium]